MEYFTQAELRLLSDALICAIRSNTEAAKMATGEHIMEAFRQDNAELRWLNTKVCNLMDED